MVYARRPEGIWKARLPQEFKGEGLIWLYQHAKAKEGDRSIIGGACLGSSIEGHGGWIRGTAIHEPIDAADMDEAACPANRGFQVDAEQVSSAWGKLVEQRPDKLLIIGGDYFDSPPKFSLHDGWLMAKSRTINQTVAYPIHRHPSLQSPLENGLLWLRYESYWLPQFDVKVELESN